jgi:hypothetical protein
LAQADRIVEKTPQKVNPQFALATLAGSVSCFLAGVSARGAVRPMILKSPTHSARVDTLRELLPDARFILMVRDPLTNFESVVRMWRKMFETYALSPIPAGEEIREAVLADRPRFEARLTQIRISRRSGSSPSPTRRWLQIPSLRSSACMHTWSLVTSAASVKAFKPRFGGVVAVRPRAVRHRMHGSSELARTGQPSSPDTRPFSSDRRPELRSHR